MYPKYYHFKIEAMWKTIHEIFYTHIFPLSFQNLVCIFILVTHLNSHISSVQDPHGDSSTSIWQFGSQCDFRSQRGSWENGFGNTSLSLVAEPFLWWGGVPVGWDERKPTLTLAPEHVLRQQKLPFTKKKKKKGMSLNWQLTEPIKITYFPTDVRKSVWSKWNTCFMELLLLIFFFFFCFF